MASAVGCNSMENKRVKRWLRQRWWFSGLPILALLLLLIAALWLAADAESAHSQLGGAYPWLFGIAGGAALILIIAVLGEAWRLFSQTRAGAPGSRLNKRLALLIAMIAIPPTLLVSGFAMRFVAVSVDSWFRADVEASQAMAVSLGRDVLDSFERRARDQAASLADNDELVVNPDLQLALDGIVEHMPDPVNLGIYDDNGVLLALAFNTSSVILPSAPTEAERLQVRQAGQLAKNERINDVLVWRVLEPLPGIGVVQSIFPLPVDLAPRLDALERTAVDYAQLRFQRNALKSTFMSILGLVTLLALLGALYAAWTATRKLIQPIADLATITRDIAAGHYGRTLPESGNDELGLIKSFNRMSAELAAAGKRETESRAEIEHSRAHLQVVLERLSAGVLSFDDRVVLTANTAAGALLDLDTVKLVDCELSVAAENFPRAADFFAQLQTHANNAHAQWREEVTLAGEPTRILLIRGVRLPGSQARYVAVFDDAQVLANVQREAAWAEVARRLAHEIKNPLTPIQLAAERLRHKYLGKMPAGDAEVLDRATHTIVAQVDALKTIVNSFSDYARPVAKERRHFDLRALLTEVLDLYEHSGQCRIKPLMPAGSIQVQGNPERLRQALINLITNALEASIEKQTPVLEVQLEARNNTAILAIRDHGHGLPTGFSERWFEPYITTKTKGTGLGLALVKKIIEEHGGKVRGENAAGGGARFVIELPVTNPDSAP